METSNREWQADELERRAELLGLPLSSLARELAVDAADSLEVDAEHGNTDFALLGARFQISAEGIVRIETPRGSFRLVLVPEPSAEALASGRNAESAWEAELASLQARDAADARSGEAGA